MKNSTIDIVGGETTFFDKIVDSIKAGKSVDRFIGNSDVLTDVKNTFFNGDNEYFAAPLRQFTGQVGVSFEAVKDLAVAARTPRRGWRTCCEASAGRESPARRSLRWA